MVTVGTSLKKTSEKNDEDEDDLDLPVWVPNGSATGCPPFVFFALAHRLEGAFKIQAGMTKHPGPRNRPNKYQGVITTISEVTLQPYLQFGALAFI